MGYKILFIYKSLCRDDREIFLWVSWRRFNNYTSAICLNSDESLHHLYNGHGEVWTCFEEIKIMSSVLPSWVNMTTKFVLNPVDEIFSLDSKSSLIDLLS